MKIYGVLAGKGELPKILKNYVKEKIVFAFIDIPASFSLEEEEHITASIGEVSKIINFFIQHKVTDIVIAGAVTKPNFKNLKTDFKGKILLAKILKNKILGDNNLLSTIITYLEKNNFTVVAINQIVANLHLKKGFNNKIKFKNNLKTDIELAQNIIKTLSKYDVGQATIVQYGRVIGIEGQEGTDNLIKRCRDYVEDNSNKPAFLLKIKKDKQDKRVDLPTIGIKTIKNLLLSNIKGIIIDSSNVIVLEKETLCAYAEKNDIFIYGI